MRLVGTFEQKERAQVITDYLCVQGLESELRAEGDDGWGVWVLDNKHLDQAKELLEQYRADPDAKIYQGVGVKAEKQRKEQEKEQHEFAERVYDKESLFGGSEMGALTLILIGICAGVAILSELGGDRKFLNYLLITRTEVVGDYIRWYRGLPDIFRHGQAWRLLTPIFIHFGIIHLLFNMLWLKDLGSMIEKRQSPWLLGFMVLLIGVGSNLAQYAVSGPNFGGMSGVVYGLLGYAWLRGRFDPLSGVQIRRETMIMMMLWFFICLTGFVGNIANTAHGVGLGMGLAWGYLSAQWAIQRRRSR